ncbi:hypothetical protein EMIHUDRAFT_107746 [Emiliania huxleyi CCMP1516]|uniref:NAA35-like N-terminal domain-containing protein n=2 Tax=Emiliania huxleyi TaxID=2903 RepID=A0A0D3HZD4_EMIH1|nr:hypothetical protein EMIHUDRAFT_107746 [Emiliania huxleyi CCMP1516]EOD04369.1 hypothetical protein EMIHUDRAFT_107746 [Emiliania huxleyi CCMP1516]|eukprot:XP_005756798.1 hypothetical protein EMIHUDRAFT_107746 [Emiliania huxleyi CCMP1516]
MSALATLESLSLSSGEEQLEEVVKGETLVWRDVLPTLDAAAGEMALGDLLHGTCFSLHEAMSALQMFDPQMDAGMATATQPPPSLPPPDLPLRAFVALADEMLCGEVAWYAGLPLVQTVFRLDWLHATREPCDARLRALMLSAVRSAAAVRALVLRADVSDEEDFAPSSFGIDLREDAEKLLAEEEERLAALLGPRGEGGGGEAAGGGNGDSGGDGGGGGGGGGNGGGGASARLLGSAPQRKVDALLAQLQPAFSIGAVTDLDGLFRWYALLAGGTDERCSLGLRPPLGPCVWEAFVTLSGLPRDTSRELSKLEPCAERLGQLAQAAPLQELADDLDGQLQRAGLLQPGVQPYGIWVLVQTLQTAAGVQATGVAAAAASGKKEKPGKKKNRGAEKGPQRPPVLLCLATREARVSVANSVLVASALKAPPPAGSRVATFSFATHPHFPLVKLEAAKPPAGGA